MDRPRLRRGCRDGAEGMGYGLASGKAKRQMSHGMGSLCVVGIKGLLKWGKHLYYPDLGLRGEAVGKQA